MMATSWLNYRTSTHDTMYQCTHCRYIIIHGYMSTVRSLFMWLRWHDALLFMNMLLHLSSRVATVHMCLTRERRRKKNKIHTTYWNFKLNPLHLRRREFLLLLLLLLVKQLHHINWCTILCVTRSFSLPLWVCWVKYSLHLHQSLITF